MKVKWERKRGETYSYSSVCARGRRTDKGISLQTQESYCSEQHTVCDGSWSQYLIQYIKFSTSLIMELGLEDVFFQEHIIPPLSESLRTMSEISNIFIGSGIFLLADIVFSIPGNSVVLATYMRA